MRRIGDRLRELRKEHGLTQDQVAERWDCRAPNVCHIESGEQCVSLPQLVAFAALVGREPGQLITELLHGASLSRFGYPLGSAGGDAG